MKFNKSSFKLILSLSTFLVSVSALVNFDDAKVVCYFASWETYRVGDGKHDIENIDPFLCTHINFGFAFINSSTYEIVPDDPWNDIHNNAYNRFVGLKNVNPDLKTILAVGGYSQNSSIFSEMASSVETRTTFINSCVNLLLNYSFDGLDIDWEYPANLGGAPEDKKNLVTLLQEMRVEFDKHGLLISLAVGMGIEVIETAYDLVNLSIYLDYFNLMAYDYFGFWENLTYHHSPLFGRPELMGNESYSYYNVNSSVHALIDGGAAKEKLILGVPFYGQTYLVENCIGELGEFADGPGPEGPYSVSNGSLGYNEICEMLMTSDSVIHRDRYTVGPFTCIGDTWVSYDDIKTIKAKSLWAKGLGLGGGMSWTIGIDDFWGTCGNGKYPLLTALNEVWRNFTTPEIPTDTKIVCYYGSWSHYKTGAGNFEVSNIEPFSCTHIIYLFAGLDNITYTITVADPNLELSNGLDNYGKFTRLTDVNPDLKVMIAIGGLSVPSVTFSTLAADSDLRSTFINSVVAFLLQYNFQGLDLIWEYPASNGGKPEDKDNFATLITEMKKAFVPHSFILSSAAAVSHSVIIDGYDMVTMAAELDFINLLTFDYHGSWESLTNHHSPLKPMPDDTGEDLYINIEATVETWLEGGVPGNKLILGYGTYGRSFTAPNNNGEIRAAATGGGEAGLYTVTPGFLAYYEICPLLDTWNISTNEYISAPWAWNSDQWVGYDDATSINIKTLWARQKGLGGGLIYTIDTDNFDKQCGEESFSLLSTINKIWFSPLTTLGPSSAPSTTVTGTSISVGSRESSTGFTSTTKQSSTVAALTTKLSSIDTTLTAQHSSTDATSTNEKSTESTSISEGSPATATSTEIQTTTATTTKTSFSANVSSTDLLPTSDHGKTKNPTNSLTTKQKTTTELTTTNRKTTTRMISTLLPETTTEKKNRITTAGKTSTPELTTLTFTTVISTTSGALPQTYYFQFINLKTFVLTVMANYYIYANYF